MSAGARSVHFEVLIPQWPAPSNVRAAFTLRMGGVSAAPFDTLNVGAHVGDAPAHVADNRQRVRSALALPGEPAWLEQVHGTGLAELEETVEPSLTADAILTRRAGKVCVVQVADCLPVLFAAADGSAVAAAHAGWRGLAAGVLEATVRGLGIEPRRLLAWLGPAISAPHFEVGAEVRAAFTATDAGASAAFVENARGRWQCDLLSLARRRLTALGVSALYGGTWCTYADPLRFFSYRRDGRCGRMAALVWLDG